MGRLHVSGSHRAGARCLALAAAVLVLTGCATRRERDPDASDAPPRDAPPVLVLEVEAPRALATVLRQHLSLARVNRLAGGEPLPPGELDRLLVAAPDEVRALAATEGWFDPQVEVRREAGTPPRVRVRVQPGPRTRVGDVTLHVDGPLADDTARGADHARAAQQALRHGWPLPPGAPFRDADWSEAKTASLARLRGAGYVGAQWLSTQARVDAVAHRADLEARVASGPLYRTGPLRVTGLQRHEESTVHNLANFRAGVPATEELLLDFQERLQKSDLYDRVSVTLAPDPGDPSATPVDVRLGERKLQNVTLGVGISANVGARGTVEHTHRRLFGRPWLARSKIELARRDQRLEAEVSTHTLPRLWRNIVGVSVARERSSSDTVDAGRVRVGRAQDGKRIGRLVYVEAERSLKQSATRREGASALGGHYHGVWRDLDDFVLPTRGRVWTGHAGAGMARSDPGGNGPFARLYARLDVFRPFGRWLAQGRVEAGHVAARGDVLVPEGLRFRAGGEGSVRGYEYRSLAPVIDGVRTSGRVLFTASLEAAHPLGIERLPQLLGAVFVDVGNAAMRWAEIDPKVGAGFGLRYRSPVGPVKLDLAWGEGRKVPRLHLTVGVEFQP